MDKSWLVCFNYKRKFLLVLPFKKKKKVPSTPLQNDWTKGRLSFVCTPYGDFDFGRPTGRDSGEWKVRPDGNNGIMRPAKTVPYGTKTRSDMLSFSRFRHRKCYRELSRRSVGLERRCMRALFFPLREISLRIIFGNSKRPDMLRGRFTSRP